MKKEKATPKSSLESSHVHNTAHLEQLKAAIVDELRLRSKPVQFDALQTMMRGQGFTRTEIVGAVNALADVGRLKFERKAFDVIMSRSAGIRVFVVLVTGGGE